MSASSSNVDSMDFCTGHWHQLAVLLKHCPDMANAFLRRPPPPDMPAGECITRLRSSADQHDLSELFEKHLFSGLLATPLKQRNQWRLPADDIAQRLFPDTDLKILLAAPWIQVPILTVQGNNSQTISMMIGLVRDSTEYRVIAPPVPDEATKTTIQKACRMAGWEFGAAYWFLQAGDDQPVRGHSLALPIALALDFLHRSIFWPSGLYATGDLALDGRILQVDGIKKKYEQVACSCRLFMVPAGNLLHSAPDRPIYACATLDEARFGVRLYSDGITAQELARWQPCRFSAERFFRHYHELPFVMARSDRAETFFQKAVDAPEKYLEMLVRCFNRCTHDRERGQRLATLFSPDVIFSLAGQSPILDCTAFDWCLAAVAFHNHQGRIRASRDWSRCASKLYDRVDAAEIVKAVNHAFVRDRFNRYDFRIDPGPAMTEVLEREEKIQEISPGSNVRLGALYGTLAQNFGFCGPDHFSSLQEMIEKGGQAFGRRYHKEKERLINYAIYGHLDYGNLEQAGELLRPYLGLTMDMEPVDWPQQIASLLTSPDDASPFKLALVLRFLGDTGYRVSGPWPAGILSTIRGRQGHPWQLIGLNLGRIAVWSGGRDEAGEFLRYSRDICMSNGDTMRPMALLALAELHKVGYAAPAEYDQSLEISQWLERTDSLKSDHFQPVLGIRDGAELLQEVDRQRARLFPFSYR